MESSEKPGVGLLSLPKAKNAEVSSLGSGSAYDPDMANQGVVQQKRTLQPRAEGGTPTLRSPYLSRPEHEDLWKRIKDQLKQQTM